MDFETFFTSADTLNTIGRFFIVYFLIIWVSLIVWVIKDITNRTTNIFLQIASVIVILVLTPLGIFVYLLIRPQKTIFEKYYEQEFQELEKEAKKPEPAKPTAKKSTTPLKSVQDEIKGKK